MKEAELRKHATCSLCKKKIGETGMPLFWRVKVENFVVDLQAVQRQQGLTMMLGGSAALAGAMGPDEEMAQRVTEVDLTVCANCAVDMDLPVAALADRGHEAVVD